MTLHCAAVVLAAISGCLARWSFHASNRSDTDGYGLEGLVLLAVVGGLLSVACQVVALVVPSEPARWERLLAQSVGVAVSGAPILVITLVGVFTLGSLLPQVGNIMSIGTGLVLLGCGGGAAYLYVARSQRSWALLLLAGSTALVVSYFSAWWVLNGLALLMNLLGAEPAGAG